MRSVGRMFIVTVLLLAVPSMGADREARRAAREVVDVERRLDLAVQEGRAPAAARLAVRRVQLLTMLTSEEDASVAHAEAEAADWLFRAGQSQESLAMCERAAAHLVAIEALVMQSVQVREQCALLAFQAGDIGLAMDHIVVALKGFREHAGERSVQVGRVMFWVGGMYRAAGIAEHAIVALEQSASIRDEVLDELDPARDLTWTTLGHARKDMGDTAGALRAYERARDLIRARDAAPATLAENLRYRGSVYLALQRVPEARDLMERGVALLEEHDPTSPELALLRSTLGQVLYEERHYQRALSIWEIALPEIERAFPQSAVLATAYGNLAAVCHALRLDEQTRSYSARQLELVEGLYGSDSPRLAQALSNWATFMGERGNAPEALEAHGRALAIYDERLPNGSPAVADLLLHYSNLLVDLSRVREARPLLERADVLIRRYYNDEHAILEEMDLAWGGLFMAEGRFDEAAVRFASAVGRVELSSSQVRLLDRLELVAGTWLGAGRPERAAPWIDRGVALARSEGDDRRMSVLYLLQARRALDQGKWGDAAQLMADSEAAMDRAELPEGLERVGLLETKARLSGALGDRRTSRRFREQIVQITTGAYGPDHPQTGLAHNNLTVDLLTLGELALARHHAEKAVRDMQAGWGPRHPHLVQARANLSSAYMGMGDIETALLEARKALELSQEVYGLDHVETARMYNNLGHVAAASGVYEEALDLFEPAIEVWSKIHPQGHPDLAVALQSKSSVLQVLGRLDEAYDFAVQAHDMRVSASGVGHPDEVAGRAELARVARMMGDLDSADRWVESAVREGPALFGTHPNMSNIWLEASLVREARGDAAGASEAATRALANQEELVSSMLGGASEREQLELLRSSRGLLDRFLQMNIENPKLGYEAVLRWKGAVSRGMVSQRQRLRKLVEGDPALSSALNELIDVRTTISEYILAGEAGSRAKELGELSKRRAELERILSRGSGGASSMLRGEHLDVAGLCRALPVGVVLVDLLEHQVSDEGVLSAWVVAHNDRGCVVHHVGLGPVDEVHKAVQRHRRAMSAKGLPTQAVDSAGQRVRDLIWQPLLTLLGSAERVVIVPDSAVASVSYASLPGTEGRYLVEDYTFSYLESAVDLVRFDKQRRGAGRGAVVVGGVDYGTQLPAAEGRSKRGCAFVDFAPLPATGDEAQHIADRLAERVDGDVRVLNGADATENNVSEAIASARVVHLATHGFFAAHQCRTALTGTERRDWSTWHPEHLVGFHPMALSGLALAGSNLGRSDRGDGIWTASEVANLDLGGVDLVVLSACETGLGELRGGEGVMGLRRAFATAGARTLVMSLWEVPDAETRDLMQVLYDEHLAERPLSVAAALRQAQLHVLASNRARDGDARPSTWSAFIASGALNAR